jgi:hypothetical protein
VRSEIVSDILIFTRETAKVIQVSKGLDNLMVSRKLFLPGGPLMMKSTQAIPYWFVAGVVSYGDGCGKMMDKSEPLSLIALFIAKAGVPGVYTRVSEDMPILIDILMI